MPIYEYECPSCFHRFEKLVRIGTEPPPCPECEGGEVRKLVSASGFILKGGGWYKDGYGLNSSKSDSKGDSKGDSKSASKPDSKPASTPPSTTTKSD